jgi:Fe-S-cluster containining protein
MPDKPSPLPQSPDLPCLCCGTCCTRFRILLTFADAECLAAFLGVPLELFLEHYIEEPWNLLPGLLLRQDGGRCPFLITAGRQELCRVHAAKPAACREWPAGLNKRVCREGLIRLWSLQVSASGQLEGEPSHLKAFLAFIEEQTKPPAQTDSGHSK